MPNDKPKRKKRELEPSEVIDELPRACSDELAAAELLERQRWGNSPCCVHCGSLAVYKMRKRDSGERNHRLLWRCKDCFKQYTVRVGTVMEDSPLPLTLWCRAMWEVCCAKNGISAMELKRKLQIGYPSALFMLNRCRYAMAKNSPTKLSGIVEADETYIGNKSRYPGEPGIEGGRSKRTKQPVFAVVQRDGEVRAQVVPAVTAENLKRIMTEHVEPGTKVYTDDFKSYRATCRESFKHAFVRHSYNEWVNIDNPEIHTNTIEGFFSRIKRSLNGTYHAVSREHLHRYVAQAAFLYNTRRLNDGERFTRIVKQANGRRLMRKQPPK